MSSNGAYVHSKHDAFVFYLVLQIECRHQNRNFGWATGHMPPWNFQNHVICYRYKVKLQNLTTLHENIATASCNHSFSKIVSLFRPCWALSFLYKMAKNLTM